MLRRKEECKREIREAMKGAPGRVIIEHLCDKDELLNKSRMYAKMTLNKDCGIGVHEHQNETEIFYILKGKAIYNDDEKEYEINEGDIVICSDGHSHGIRNIEDNPCEFIALIILK